MGAAAQVDTSAPIFVEVERGQSADGLQAWKQRNLRFEPRLELQNSPAANTIDETKVRAVEITARIDRAEKKLCMQLQEMQQMTVLLQVMHPTTKQHTAISVPTSITSTPA